MSINLKDYLISASLPESLNDRNVKQLAELSDEFLHKVDALIERVLIYPRIDELDNDLINHLGYQQHIERFSTTLPLEAKRELVKNSFLIHMRKGTPWAVETAISLMLAPTEIIEWFNYNGQPYHFRPIIDMTDARVVLDRERKKELFKVINSTKNVRSWLDAIIVALHPEDVIEIPKDKINLQLDFNYTDLIPYGNSKAEIYSPELIYPFEYKPVQDLNIDEINLRLGFNFADDYKHLLEYGLFNYGESKAIYGGFITFPVDKKISLTISKKIEDVVEKTNDFGGSLTINHYFKYGDKSEYGGFLYGQQTLTDRIDGDLELTKEGAVKVWEKLSA